MSVTECLVAAIVLVAGASMLAIAVRAGWLAATTTRALAALPRAQMPESLQAAARRAGITRLRCLAGTDRTAFCAGLLRPCVYVTTATAKLNTNELDAVLAHEAAHARRRDPLRRLLTRAAADVHDLTPAELDVPRYQGNRVAGQQAVEAVRVRLFAPEGREQAKRADGTRRHGRGQGGRGGRERIGGHAVLLHGLPDGLPGQETVWCRAAPIRPAPARRTLVRPGGRGYAAGTSMLLDSKSLLIFRQ